VSHPSQLPNRCPRCGAELAPTAPSGLCGRCALKEALRAPQGDEDVGALFLQDIPLPGQTIAYIGDYEIIEIIARGGMGVIYKAKQKSLNRVVALKMLLGGGHASEDFRRRFRQEAETAAQLQHPNIVPIYEVGEHEGQPYFSMEYVEGTDLAKLVTAQPLVPIVAAEHLKAVADAVHYAHQQGVLHRDLKPSNILLGRDNRPRITDFGLARIEKADSDLTLSGQMLGTPGYLPPEQASVRRGKAGPYSDVYALGATLYHLLTGRPPFMAGTAADTIQQVLTADPVSPRRLNPALPKDLNTICLKCLAKEPARRYASAAVLAEDLGRFLRGEPILARPVSVGERLLLWARRNPVVATLASTLAVTLCIGAVAVLWQWREAERQRQRAEKANQVLAGTVTRMAEDAFANSLQQDALASLAAAVRLNPTNALAAHRLASALSQRSFALPIAPALTDGRDVITVELSPGGDFVVVDDWSPQLRLWSLPGGGARVAPLVHEGRVAGWQQSADGRKLLVLTDGSPVKLWDTQTGKLLFSFAPPGGVAAVAMTTNADIILLGASDGTMFSINPAPEGWTNQWLAHTGGVAALAVSLDGRLAVSSGQDARVKVWDIPGGVTKRLDLSVTKKGGDLVLSGDGHHLISSLPTGPVEYCDLEADRPAFRTLPKTGIHCAQFSPDGTRFVTGGEAGEVIVWDAVRGVALTNFPGHVREVWGVAFSPDGLRVATASIDGTAQVWDLHTARLVCEPLRHENRVTCVGFGPDGSWLMTACSDKAVRLWDVRPGTCAPSPILEPAGIVSARVLPGGHELLTIATNGSVRIWDLERAAPKRTLWEGNDAIQRFALNPKATRLALVDAEHRAWIVDLDLGRHRPLDVNIQSNVNAMVFSPDGRLLGIAEDTRVDLLETATGKRLRPPLECHATNASYGDGIYDVCFNGPGSQIAAGTHAAVAYLWDVQTGRSLGQMKHDGPVVHVEFSADDTRLLCSSLAGSAAIWNLADLHGPMRSLRHRHGPRPADVEGLKRAIFSPNSAEVFTWSLDGTGSAWDVETGAELLNPLRFGGRIFLASFDGAGGRIVTLDDPPPPWPAPAESGGEVKALERSFRVWDVATGLPLSEPYATFMRALVWSDPAATRFVATSPAGRILVWPGAELPLPCPDWLAPLTEAVAGHRADEKGAISLVPASEFLRLKAEFSRREGTDPWLLWAKWFFADRSKRTLSWSNPLTTPELIERRIASGTVRELREAVALDPTNALALATLAVRTLGEDGNPLRFQEADFLSRRAATMAPGQAEVVRLRREVEARVATVPSPPSR